ncbi:hypothetical protein ACSBR1_030273 [Camellia fascicularis]
MSVVPKVWKRLMVTFLCIFFTLFLYNVVAVLLFILWAFTVGDTDAAAGVLIIMVRLYAIGFIYLTIVWQLAGVVSVLEDSLRVQSHDQEQEPNQREDVDHHCYLLQAHLGYGGDKGTTVIYFVCKTYHHENIDKWTLSDHLEVYLGEYVPLTAKDVQLEQAHV